MKRPLVSQNQTIAIGMVVTATAFGVFILTSQAPKSAVITTTHTQSHEPDATVSPEPTIIVNGQTIQPSPTGPTSIATGESTTTVTHSGDLTNITTVNPRTGTTSTVSGDGSMNVTVQTDNSNGTTSMHQSVINTNQTTNDRTYSRSTVKSYGR